MTSGQIVIRPSASSGGGGSWVGPIAITDADFQSGTNGYYAELMTLTDGWVIHNVIASCSEAFNKDMYFGVDITDYNEATPDQAWLSNSATFAFTQTDSNGILTGIVDSYGGYDLRMVVMTNAVNAIPPDGYLGTTVIGSDHVLQMWCNTAPAQGAANIWVETSAPTPA